MASGDLHQQYLGYIAQLINGGKTSPPQLLHQILVAAAQHRLIGLTDHVMRQTGLIVQTGPFASMRYVTASAGSALIPKLLGCYEEELHDVIRSFCRPYRRVVNIGCGEGYYAVGLAHIWPSVQVHAFDSDAAAQNLCRQLAEINGVADRVVVSGTCGLSELRELAGPETLIFCDCEGGELSLLDPVSAPGLLQSDLIVECHDFINARISSLLVERFASSHLSRLARQRGRNPNLYPALEPLDQLSQWLAVWEQRPGPTPWATMTPYRQVPRAFSTTVAYA